MLNGLKELQNVCSSPDLGKQVLGDVVDIFTNDIDMSQTTDNQDILGRAYEYCIQQFAEKEGVSGGEFYTPASVVKTLVSIHRPTADSRIYDCCCGEGVIIMTHGKKALNIRGFKLPQSTKTCKEMRQAA